MNMNYNIFKIYYKIGRALPFEVRRFPRGVQTLWYSSQSVLVTKIFPRGQYGEAWGYYLKDGERSDSYWCSKDINEPQPIPCCGCGGWTLVRVIGQPIKQPDSELELLKGKRKLIKLTDLMPFGKYKNIPISVIKEKDPSYFQWMLANLRDYDFEE
jgi:hypothetical protein